MITISFYSYKGGVGRSLTLANLGVYLAQFGATVAMVDFDLEAPGLHYKIRPNEPIKIDNRGLAGLLADLSRGVSMEDLDWDLAIDVSDHAEPPKAQAGKLESPAGHLLLIPAGNPMLPGYWNDLAAIDWDVLFTSKARRGVSALAHLKTRIEEKYSPDVLLVDSRTGITPGGGVATTLLPDVVVTMMLNSAEHLDGSRLVISAVTGAERGPDPGPVVVPVLSRYTDPQIEDRQQARGIARMRSPREQLRVRAMDEAREDIPLDSLFKTLVSDLPSAAERVKGPLVLHADPSLQHREYLTFGPYAQTGAGASGQTLLEDYLRLFAALVPRDMFLRYLTGVRERARGILLDNPDDAVRTLESLATLVGDEAAFEDLVKVYLLRRDTRKLLLAAESLYRVHERIVPHPALSKELRNRLLTGRPRVQGEAIVVSGPFAERYWREVGAEDIEWGAAVARLYADREQAAKAKDVAGEVIRATEGPKEVAEAIRVIALGSPAAEVLAVQLTMEYFELGKKSGVFLSAAALACKYQESAELATMILEAPGSEALPAATLIHISIVAGRFEDAGALFIDAFGATDPDEAELEDLAEDWEKLTRRIPGLRAMLDERNPELGSRLDADIAEDPF